MSKDTIYRQAAIDALGEEPMVWTDSDYEIAQRNQWNVDKLAIETVPSAEPEREKGTWTNDASCPFCGFQPWYERDIHTLSFCSNCGADLRGEE